MRTVADPRRPTRERVLEMYLDDKEVREIAARLKISTQRVYQHLAALREAGEIEARSA
jgi:predicted ArsR family transcriptional regulator